jgi:AAA+ ATPase superfamily predicted ATPase
MKTNPFLISGYISPEYFCDREIETARLLNAINNSRNLTLFSPRRMGKSSLIKHVFNSLDKKKNITTVYADIMAAASLADFAAILGNALFTTLGKNENIIKKLLKQLATLKLKLSIDPLSGEPSISLDVTNSKEAGQTLNTIFEYLASQHSKYVIAIDEFQQITSFPEKNIEAILRTHIQGINNACFIFSGSSRHILTEIFSMPDRPFYNSTEIMEIGIISPDIYKEFIQTNFRKGSMTISTEALDRIEKITGMHTFYVQYICNRLFSNSGSISIDEVNKTLINILNENEPVYSNYLRLITPGQFRILKAIALNGGVENPTSKEFLSDYNLGAASSVNQAIGSLTEKDFIFLSDKQLQLNDVFFSQWIKYKSGI